MSEKVLKKPKKLDKNTDIAILLLYHARGHKACYTACEKSLYLIQEKLSLPENLRFEYKDGMYGPISYDFFDTTHLLDNLDLIELKDSKNNPNDTYNLTEIIKGITGYYPPARTSETIFQDKKLTLTDAGLQIGKQLDKIMDDKTRVKFDSLAKRYCSYPLTRLLDELYSCLEEEVE